MFDGQTLIQENLITHRQFWIEQQMKGKFRDRGVINLEILRQVIDGELEPLSLE